jgi:hypothetical protein
LQTIKRKRTLSEKKVERKRTVKNERKGTEILVGKEDERKDTELQVETGGGINTKNDEDNVRLGILISWKGTKGRGNSRKNSVKILQCCVSKIWELRKAGNLRNISNEA